MQKEKGKIQEGTYNVNIFYNKNSKVLGIGTEFCTGSWPVRYDTILIQYYLPVW